MLLWSLTFLTFAYTAKITSKQNEDLKMNCGAGFREELLPSLQNIHPKFISMGGAPAEIAQLPFMARLSIEIPNTGGNTWTKIIAKVCSGVQISPRHIMTAAHCVFVYDNLLLETICSDKMMDKRIPLKLHKPADFSVYLGSACPSKGLCFPSEKNYKAREVIPHPDVDLCKFVNDIAVIELATDVLPNNSVSICMAESDTFLRDKLQSAGFGLDPYAYSMKPSQLKAVELTKSREYDGKIVTADKTKSLCNGDSGGPLFQYDAKGRITLVGIVSTVEPQCYQIASERRNNFTDVRSHLQWICDVTGVCPTRHK